MPVQNPVSFTVTDSKVAAEGVTAFRVLFGQVSGGPYTLTSADVPVASLTVAGAAYTGTIAALNEQLAPGPWFAVAEAVSASGASANSPEAAFVIVPPAPSAPEAFICA